MATNLCLTTACQQPEMIPNCCEFQDEHRHNCGSWGTGGCDTVVSKGTFVLCSDYSDRIITFYHSQMFPTYLPSALSHLLKTKDFSIFHSSEHTHARIRAVRAFHSQRSQRSRENDKTVAERRKGGCPVTLPALTVMASMNWSLQLLVPTSRARLVFFISLSTVFCQRPEKWQC